jgi:hypothetical protein
MPVLAIGEGDIFTKFPVMSLTGIEIENFDVQGLALSTLAKPDADCSWPQLTAMLDYKLQMLVSSLPGSIREQPPGPARSVRPSPTGLTEREHRCNCGCRPEREFAAAMVVHFRAFGFWPGTGPDRQASGLPPSLVQKPPALDGGSSQQAGSHPFPCANRFAMVWQ